MLGAIGSRLLRDLGARDARSALSQLGTRYSARSLQITRNSLERAIRHAESNDLVGRNVAALSAEETNWLELLGRLILRSLSLMQRRYFGLKCR